MVGASVGSTALPGTFTWGGGTSEGSSAAQVQRGEMHKVKGSDLTARPQTAEARWAHSVGPYVHAGVTVPEAPVKSWALLPVPQYGDSLPRSFRRSLRLGCRWLTWSCGESQVRPLPSRGALSAFSLCDGCISQNSNILGSSPQNFLISMHHGPKMDHNF